MTQEPDNATPHPPEWDWANRARYRDLNTELGPPAPGERRVVFIGASVMEGWGPGFQGMFPGRPYVNRGIGGQTSGQVLLRFRQDAVGLKPAAVVIHPGVNDIASNRGPHVLEDIASNLMSMSDLARANGIRVALATNGPVSRIPWAPDLEPAGTVRALNAWIREFAGRNGFPAMDFEAALMDADGGFPPEYAEDGVHPTPEGYRVMAPVALTAIDAALSG